jgi:enamidase
MRVAIVNIGTIVSGYLDEPFVAGDTIVTDGDRIVAVGTASASEVEACDVVIDADGTTAIPGLIDSHVHITFGDFTPRQQTVGYLESYVHGGVTTAISASEVHVPGRPRDAEGVKALAVAAQKCFEHYRPGGMKVYAGSVILEPTLNGNDLGEIAKQGIWLAKAGFGAFKTAFEYAPLVAAARAHGMITTCHTGGSSIPGSGAITGDHLLAMKPHVSFHVNGGPPLGMLYTMSHLASLAGIAPELCIAAATGSNARVYGLDSGLLAAGKAADVVLLDAPDGGTQDNALAAIKNGDIAAVGAVITGGRPRFVGRSRNTPATMRTVRVASCKLPQDFSGVPH